MPSKNTYIADVIANIERLTTDPNVRSDYYQLLRRSMVWEPGVDIDDVRNVERARTLIEEKPFSPSSMNRQRVLPSLTDIWAFLNQAGESMSLPDLRRKINKRTYAERFSGETPPTIGKKEVYTYKEIMHILDISPNLDLPEELKGQ